MTFTHEMICCIVNSGFSEAVMDAAKDAGARGGTVIPARGAAHKEAEEFFKISIQPSKEIVIIIVPTELKSDILHALYREVGLNTPGQGIAFSLPVDEAVGLTTYAQDLPGEEKATEQELSPPESNTATAKKERKKKRSDK